MCVAMRCDGDVLGYRVGGTALQCKSHTPVPVSGMRGREAEVSRAPFEEGGGGLEGGG